MSGLRMGLGLLLLAFAVLAGSRVVGQMQAERAIETAARAPGSALAQRSAGADMHVLDAERAAASGDIAAARGEAKQALADAPLEGRAFRVIAQSMAREDPAGAARLFAIAQRRAPRDLATRAWLAQHSLEDGDFDAALRQVDRVMRIAPAQQAAVFAGLVPMTADERFAEALASALRANPPWRAAFFNALRQAAGDQPAAEGRMMGMLLQRGDLTEAEYGDWLDSLMRQGRWGEAQARWVGQFQRGATRIPLLFNGDFAREPSGRGFDWRMEDVPGVVLALEDSGDRGRRLVHFEFREQRVADTGLRHALVLSPGRYTLSARVRAQGLRALLGLQFRVTCAQGAVLARSEPLDGSFDWRGVETDFEVPSDGCPGQWLTLANAIDAGAAQQLAGELWIESVTIQPASPAAAPAHAP